MDQQSLNQLITFLAAAAGAILAAIWLGLVVWTWRDMHARSRDRIAQLAATLVVIVLNVPGVLVYLLLRPRETLAEAYEHSLEEEALLQGIEEKNVCPGCGRPTQARWQLCPACYTRLKKPCVACGELLELTWPICPVCATPQPTNAQAVSVQPAGSPADPRYTSRSLIPTAQSDSTLEYLENSEG